jgi:hypothetical protein
MGDLLFQITEWLRTTWLNEFSQNLSNTDLSLWIVTHFWATGILQFIHILAISTAWGAILMVNLRMFAIAGTERTIAQTERRYVRWIWGSLVVLILSGIGLILSDAVRNLLNAVFWIKMILVIGAILTSLAFHRRMMRRLAGGGTVGVGIRTASLAIVVLWLVIMLCGRWIAYAPT